MVRGFCTEKKFTSLILCAGEREDHGEDDAAVVRASSCPAGQIGLFFVHFNRKRMVKTSTEVLQCNRCRQFNQLFPGKFCRQALIEFFRHPHRGVGQLLGKFKDVLFQRSERRAGSEIGQRRNLFGGDTRLTGESVSQIDSKGALDAVRRPVHGEALESFR